MKLTERNFTNRHGVIMHISGNIIHSNTMIFISVTFTSLAILITVLSNSLIIMTATIPIMPNFGNSKYVSITLITASIRLNIK